MPRSPKVTAAEPGAPGEVVPHGLSSGPASEDEDEDEILETSENGRWQKFNEHVSDLRSWPWLVILIVARCCVTEVEGRVGGQLHDSDPPADCVPNKAHVY